MAFKNLTIKQEDDSIRRFRYLLGLTDLFRHFIETNPNPRIKEIMVEIDRQNAEAEKAVKKGRDRQGGAAVVGRRRTEAEEDAELLKDEKAGGSAETVFRESPGFIKGGEMRDYQVAGLNWLISLHENGISGILADEMGLGKTLQTISFLGYLRHIMDITGPHLVVVPKSTLDNWKREFAKWTPEVNVLVLQGAKDERHTLINERLIDEKFDVCITSYEMILREKSHLKKFAWEYIIIDEVSPRPLLKLRGICNLTLKGPSYQERRVLPRSSHPRFQLSKSAFDYWYATAEQPTRALGFAQFLTSRCFR